MRYNSQSRIFRGPLQVLTIFFDLVHARTRAIHRYAPAYKRHGEDVRVLHFIGENKPWKRGTRGTYDPDAASKDYYGLVGQWFDAFERHFGSVLTYDVAGRVMPPPASFKSTFTSLPSHIASSSSSAAASSRGVPTPASVPAVNVRPPSPAPSKPAPIPIPPAVAAGRTSPPIIAWDPSRSSPPRDGSFQMRDPIPAGYNNVWDDPSASKRPARFEPPEQYPQPPKETHEWYKAVMQAKPDPSAVKPVFPWEEPKTPTRSSSAHANATTRKFGDSPPPAIETPRNAPPPLSFRASSFTNAWDAIPGISKYAESLAKQTTGNGSKRSSHQGGASAGSGPGSSSGSITPKAAGSGSGGRKSRSTSTSSGSAGPSSAYGSSATTVSGAGGSSRAKVKGGSNGGGGISSSYPVKGDASSRDGDDEDDEEADLSTTDQDGNDFDEYSDDSEERDRIAIKFRRAESSGVSPTNTRSSIARSGAGVDSSSSLERTTYPAQVSPPKKDSRFVPTSPRQSRAGGGGGGTPMPMTATTTLAPAIATGAPTHLGKPNLHLSLPTRTTPLTSTTTTTMTGGGPVSPRISGVTSPRLAAQAIRNSTAARLVSSGSGHGDAPPVVRATRVFSPETDTGVVKQQGLAALQRFVETMEAESAAAAAAASGSPGSTNSTPTVSSRGTGGDAISRH